MKLYAPPVVLCAFVLVACERKAAPDVEQSPPAAPVVSAPAAAEPVPAASGSKLGIEWTAPKDWQQAGNRSPMRAATYRIPKAGSDEEDGELAVFYFGPGQGGDIEANVSRWIGQFEGVPNDAVRRADREANGMRQHTIEIENGTYQSGMPGGPKSPKQNFGLLGAIVQAPSGNYFFKLTGPSSTVREARDEFYALLDSVKRRS
jgi:hypothetical protein